MKKTCAAIKRLIQAGRKETKAICERCDVRAPVCPYRPKDGK